MSKPKKPYPSNKPSGEVWKSLSYVTLFGIVMATCTFSGYYLGSWLERVWGGGGFWVAAGVLVGMGVGILSLYIILKPTMVDRDE
ncbi:AtpZ/AtpI family protein [Paenibacillus sp.]|jgi:hypothetical protein|uniref:AtpZ/AtpI family protein n=1 Tax=Paenibacillus sp. TaxID=58172 RepID=UPI002818A119|nr:AtpZ/AtpI family protein [Paenibacillus sp.]MDR0266703.1 AtpZ/AtpI family protein [Paenibacillus sp.]